MSDEHEQLLRAIDSVARPLETLVSQNGGILEAVRALKPEQSQLLGGVGCTIGVGDGSVQLFVHGSYEACQRVRSFVDEVERLRAENNSLKGSLQAHEAMFSSIREACDLAELAEQDDGYLCGYVERVTAELKRLRAENAELGAEDGRRRFRELKRFREREPLVSKLLVDVADEVHLLRDMGGHTAFADLLESAIDAVRDFKVTT